MERILKASDEGADLVLFTGNAGVQSVGDEVVDVVVHSANMPGWCEVTGGVSVRHEVADEDLGEEIPLGHRCILRHAHEPSMCYAC